MLLRSIGTVLTEPLILFGRKKKMRSEGDLTYRSSLSVLLRLDGRQLAAVFPGCSAGALAEANC